MTENIITNSVGVVSNVHDRGFGFIIFTTESGRRLRIYFHQSDTVDHADVQAGDTVSFNIGIDGQRRPRAFHVKFITSPEAASTEGKGGAL